MNGQLAEQVGVAVLFGVCLFIAVLILGTLVIEHLAERDAADSPAER